MICLNKEPRGIDEEQVLCDLGNRLLREHDDVLASGIDPDITLSLRLAIVNAANETERTIVGMRQ